MTSPSRRKIDRIASPQIDQTSPNGGHPRPQTTPLLLSADRLADLLGVSVRTLWRLRSAGRLPRPVRLGASVRWRADEVTLWVAAGCPPLERGNVPGPEEICCRQSGNMGRINKGLPVASRPVEGNFMASLFKPTYTKVDPKTGRKMKRKSRKWYVKYRDADGVVRRVPGYNDKEATRQLAADLERPGPRVARPGWSTLTRTTVGGRSPSIWTITSVTWSPRMTPPSTPS